MKKALLLFAMFSLVTPAYAGGLVTKHASSVQLTVDAARSTATRVGSSYAISGSGVNTTDGTDAGTVASGSITSGILTPNVISATQATDGNAFSFSASYTAGDAIPTSAATTGEIPNFSNVTSYTAGTAGSLAGTVTSAGALTVTAGGAGSTAIGQFVSEITVID